MLRIGVVGTGHWQKIHVNYWREMENVTLAGVLDSTECTSSNLQELLENCDAVDIIASTTDNFALASEAIRKGRHVLVKGPMAETMSQAEGLVKLVRESKVKFQISHTLHFNPAVCKLQTFQPQPIFLDLRLNNPFDNGQESLPELLTPDFELVLSLVKADVKHLNLSVINAEPGLLNARIEFTNGSVASLTISQFQEERKHQLQIFQEQVWYHLDLNSQSLAINEELVLHPANKDFLKDDLMAFALAIEHNEQVCVNEIAGYRAMDLVARIREKIYPKTVAS